MIHYPSRKSSSEKRKRAPPETKAVAPASRFLTGPFRFYSKMNLCFSKPAAGAVVHPLPHPPDQLEGEFQSDLHHALAAGTDERIAGREVRRQERSAERNARTRGISGVDGTRGARRIGGDGMVEDIEDFPARLNAIALF